MGFNFAVAGNTCPCYCFGGGRFGSMDEIYHPTNEFLVQKAIVTEKVMETAIRPTSHFGKAVENLSIAIREKFSKNKKEKDDVTRDKVLDQAKKHLFRSSFRGSPMPKRKNKEQRDLITDNLIDLESSPKSSPQISPMQPYKRYHNKGKLYD